MEPPPISKIRELNFVNWGISDFKASNVALAILIFVLEPSDLDTISLISAIDAVVALSLLKVFPVFCAKCIDFLAIFC